MLVPNNIECSISLIAAKFFTWFKVADLIKIWFLRKLNVLFSTTITYDYSLQVFRYNRHLENKLDISTLEFIYRDKFNAKLSSFFTEGVGIVYVTAFTHLAISIFTSLKGTEVKCFRTSSSCKHVYRLTCKLIILSSCLKKFYSWKPDLSILPTHTEADNTESTQILYIEFAVSKRPTLMRK